MEEVGQVFVSVKEIRALPITEPSDIYCIIQLEQQKVRTSVCARVAPNGRAEWTEGYTFDVTTDADLSVKVWGKSTTSQKGKLLGVLTLPTSTAKNLPPVEASLPLSPPPQAGPGFVGAELFYRTSYVCSTNKVGYDDFTILKLIGKGAFGKVMLVRKNDTGRLYAMKQLDKDHVRSLAAVTFTLTERHVLKTYNHPFVVSLKYSFQTKSHLFMVLDYVGGGELFYHMAERGVFDEETVRFYAAQIVLALGFLHDHAVTYRDLKPENLLLDIHGNICLCDFGLCKEQVDGENTFTLCGSPEYMAPEVLQGKGYGRGVDWWALGILIFEMLTGLPPFYSEDPVEMSQNILSAPIHFPDHLSKNIMSLIVQLLKRDPARRLGSGPNDAEDIKAHPFFATVDWKRLLKKDIEPPFKPHLTSAMDLTYFDPNCTESSVGSASDMHPSPAGSDPEDCFAQFSFVAPAEFGSTPHGNNNNTPNNTSTSMHTRKPLLASLHTSSPMFSSSPNLLSQQQQHSGSPRTTPPQYTHTPPTHVLLQQHSPHSPHTPPSFAHPLAGMGIPRSPANYSLASIPVSSSPFATSSSHTPPTTSQEVEFNDVVSTPPRMHASPLQTSLPLPSSVSNPSLGVAQVKPTRPPLWSSASTPNLFAQNGAAATIPLPIIDEEGDDKKKGGKTFKAIVSSVFKRK